MGLGRMCRAGVCALLCVSAIGGCARVERASERALLPAGEREPLAWPEADVGWLDDALAHEPERLWLEDTAPGSTGEGERTDLFEVRASFRAGRGLLRRIEAVGDAGADAARQG